MIKDNEVRNATSQNSKTSGGPDGCLSGREVAFSFTGHQDSAYNMGYKMQLPYFKFFVDSWGNGKINALSHEEKGIFIDLVCLIWRDEGMLNIAIAHLAKLLRCDEDALERAINNLADLDILQKNDSGFSVKFLVEQRKELAKAHKAKVNAGKKGAKQRYGRPIAEPAYIDKEEDIDIEVDKDNNTPGTSGKVKKKKPVKEAYGEFKKVLLTAEEHRKLIDTHGTGRATKAIEILDGYIASKGAKYVSHYAVFKSDSWIWGRVDEGKSTADRRREEKAAKECPEPDYSKLIRSY